MLYALFKILLLLTPPTLWWKWRVIELKVILPLVCKILSKILSTSVQVGDIKIRRSLVSITDFQIGNSPVPPHINHVWAPPFWLFIRKIELTTSGVFDTLSLIGTIDLGNFRIGFGTRNINTLYLEGISLFCDEHTITEKERTAHRLHLQKLSTDEAAEPLTQHSVSVGKAIGGGVGKVVGGGVGDVVMEGRTKKISNHEWLFTMMANSSKTTKLDHQKEQEWEDSWKHKKTMTEKTKTVPTKDKKNKKNKDDKKDKKDKDGKDGNKESRKGMKNGHENEDEDDDDDDDDILEHKNSTNIFNVIFQRLSETKKLASSKLHQMKEDISTVQKKRSIQKSENKRVKKEARESYANSLKMKVGWFEMNGLNSMIFGTDFCLDKPFVLKGFQGSVYDLITDAKMPLLANLTKNKISIAAKNTRADVLMQKDKVILFKSSLQKSDVEMKKNTLRTCEKMEKNGTAKTLLDVVPFARAAQQIAQLVQKNKSVLKTNVLKKNVTKTNVTKTNVTKKSITKKLSVDISAGACAVKKKLTSQAHLLTQIFHSTPNSINSQSGSSNDKDDKTTEKTAKKTIHSPPPPASSASNASSASSSEDVKVVDAMGQKWLQEMAMKKAISDVDSHPVPHPSTLTLGSTLESSASSSSSSVGSSLEEVEEEKKKKTHRKMHSRDVNGLTIYWQPDSEVKHCTLCSVKFDQVLKRKHHCRTCGQIFCKNCSKGKLYMSEQLSLEERVSFSEDFLMKGKKKEKKERACDTCVAKSTNTNTKQKRMRVSM